MKAPFAISMLLAIAVLHVNGQSYPPVSGNYLNVRFDSFVTSVEQQSRVRFYYRKEWTDSLTVTLSANAAPLDQLLTDVFRDTELRYVMDDQERIFITSGREILTQLPPGFSDTPARQTRAADFDLSHYELNEKKQVQEEARVRTIGQNTGIASATLAGNVRDAQSGEPLIGASVYIEKPTIGVTTDQFGYYALTIPTGRHEIKIKSIGMKNTTRQVLLYGNGRLDIEMVEDITPLKEVVVEADAEAHVAGLQMGMEKLDIKTMRQIPLALGETDIMKVVLTLPGVQSVGEGTVGLNVRGGAANQNLILFNDAVVYNPSHLFGFFSTFNPDVLKNVELYKSAIQADYGGRLSSVLDVHTREGNTKKFSGSGGISPITGRFSVEGPLVKDKTSFIIGGRSTYSGWLLRQLDAKELRNSAASFYDVTANVSHRINDNNNLYLSVYSSKDKFNLNNDTAYSYRDENASIKWKHLFNNKFYGVLSTGFSHYEYAIASTKNPVNAFGLDFDIRQLNAKADFSFFPNARHTLTAGLSTIRYDLDPGTMRPRGESSLIRAERVQREQGLESAFYISETFEASPKLSVYAGVRYSHFAFLGPKDVFSYAPDVPRQQSNIIDTLHFTSAAPIKVYHGAEPRFSARYMISKTGSVKISYNRMRQYVQVLSNTVAINPTDVWKLSDAYIRPQLGDQFSFGYYQYLKGNTIETSVETYYKNSPQVTDYKNGAVLLLNHHLETEVAQARGKAYGIEMMVKKLSGKVNGWASYTYSRSLVQTVGEFTDEIVNNGAYYPSNFDKPHAFNFIGNYKFNRRINFSLNVIYSTGRPITLPIAKYEVEGTTRIYYSARNQFRIPDYFRTDISINLEGNHKIRKLAHSSWTLALYNVTGRANPFSVYFVSENSRIAGYKLSIFARPIPTLTYNFKF